MGAAPPVRDEVKERKLTMGNKIKGGQKQLPTSPEGLDELAWDDAEDLTRVKHGKAAARKATAAYSENINDDDDEMI